MVSVCIKIVGDRDLCEYVWLLDEYEVIFFHRALRGYPCPVPARSLLEETVRDL